MLQDNSLQLEATIYLCVVQWMKMKLTLDERKTLTKVSTRTTSHKHSPNQSAPFGQQMQAATEQRRNKETSFQQFAQLRLKNLA